MTCRVAGEPGPGHHERRNVLAPQFDVLVKQCPSSFWSMVIKVESCLVCELFGCFLGFVDCQANPLTLLSKFRHAMLCKCVKGRAVRGMKLIKCLDHVTATTIELC